MIRSKKTIVHILGDLHQDNFVCDKNKLDILSNDGGVLFVKKILEAKEFVKKNKCKITQKDVNHECYGPCQSEHGSCIDIIHDYVSKTKTACSLGPLIKLKWEVQVFEEGKYRCKDRLRVIRKLSSSNQEIYFNDQKLLKTLDNGDENYFLMESNGSSVIDGKTYNGVFTENGALTKIIIKILDFSKKEQDKGGLKIPRFFWILHHEFPNFFNDAQHWNKIFSENENALTKDEIAKIKSFKQRSIIFLNANTLRHLGIYIRKHISWESIAQDYISALYTSPLLAELRSYNHIITRFGITGAIYSYKLGEGRWTHRLIFDPLAPKTGLFRDVTTQGDMIGYQSVFAACVFHEIVDYINRNNDHDPVVITERIVDGIRKAMKSCQHIFDLGFPKLGELRSKDKKFGLEGYWANLATIFDKASSNVNDEWKKIGHERIPVANPGWSILTQSAEYKLIEIAEDLVYKGVPKALNNYQPGNPTYWAPIVQFGEEEKDISGNLLFNNPLIVIDRREIESYRTIHGLMSQAINKQSDKILSIAVFGPPGSGKSFTVKKLALSIYSEHKVGFETINMTEITDQAVLEEKIITACFNLYTYLPTEKEITEANNNNKEPKKGPLVPIIFFDEFDTSCGNEKLGWLKSFLKPMEDLKKDFFTKKGLELLEKKMKEISRSGTELEYFKDLLTECDKRKDLLKEVKKIINPIFVFAGGTSHNYRDFCREDPSWSDDQKADFKMAKGPDFVSRLRGHIDILGPNRVDDFDDGYVIRRAILLRSMILKRLKNNDNTQENSSIEISKLNNNSDLTDFIDKAIVKALLKVSSFKHGARSMEAVINMSTILGGSRGRLLCSTLPSLQQLNMHVNGKEFLDMVIEESTRRQPEKT